ncbi:XkdX family protein [uncultured Lactobacillus sp.]|uniref:XkdX family protein n=1 Tax=uncultured Lactobacillus sp. TaxID=153152 RepID=UPI00261078A4|nr:XkdX family protein [uncultured Lactobacillus sp.]
MGIFAEQFEQMYKMDYQFGWMDKNGLRGIVAQGFLSTEGYERITGDKYDSEISEQA